MKEFQTFRVPSSNMKYFEMKINRRERHKERTKIKKAKHKQGI
jgi:hypothetical protein